MLRYVRKLTGWQVIGLIVLVLAVIFVLSMIAFFLGPSGPPHVGA